MTSLGLWQHATKLELATMLCRWIYHKREYHTDWNTRHFILIQSVQQFSHHSIWMECYMQQLVSSAQNLGNCYHSACTERWTQAIFFSVASKLAGNSLAITLWPGSLMACGLLCLAAFSHSYLHFHCRLLHHQSRVDNVTV